MGSLDGLGFQFTEQMSGFLGVGERDPRLGVDKGRSEATPVSFDVRIHIADLGRFLRTPLHEAELTGTVSFAPLGGTFPVRRGRFNLFTVDPQTGIRHMIHAFLFTARDGRTYYLCGHKEISDDPGRIDVVEDMTRLFTTVYCGEDDQALVYGAGELYFRLRDGQGPARGIAG